jgi:DNA-binding transcriptional LysR family regulator
MLFQSGLRWLILFRVVSHSRTIMGAAVQWDDRIGRRLKLRDLHIFMMVVQQGSMGKAAKRLAVSQPVVSKVISDLERMLNVRLLDRTAQGVEPTLYGSALVRSGAIVFDDLTRGVKEIEFLADPTAGEVRIASLEAMNASFIPAVIGRLMRQFPRLVFDVRQAPHLEALYQMVRERSVDLIFVHVTAPIEHEDLNVEILFLDSLSVVAGADCKWVRRRNVDLAELVDAPWCLPVLIAPQIARAFREKGLATPRYVVTTNSLQLIQALAVNRDILSFSSTTRLRLSGKSSVLKAVPVDLHIPYGSVGIVTLKNRTVSPVAQLFIKGARELAKRFAG